MAKKNSPEINKIKYLLSDKRERYRVAAGNKDIVEDAIRREMARKRRRIKKVAGGNSGSRDQRLVARRFAKDRSRKLKKTFARRRNWAIPLGELLNKRIPSPILDRLDPERKKRWKPIVSRKFKREPNRIQLGSLNFLDHPIETMAEFQKLSQAERKEVHAYLDFADTHCLDVGAYLVLSEIWPQLSKVFMGGKMSRPVQKVLSAIRMDEELDIGLAGVQDHEDVWAFPVRHRRPRGTTSSETANLEPQDREKVADELCELINEWLDVADGERGIEGHPGWELSPEGKSLLARMSGELLDNAERHSIPESKDGDWSMTAFMAARECDNGERELRCYMAFLNIGQSIADAMRRGPSTLLSAVEKYVGQFGRRGPSRDTLLTVVAL